MKKITFDSGKEFKDDYSEMEHYELSFDDMRNLGIVFLLLFLISFSCFQIVY